MAGKLLFRQKQVEGGLGKSINSPAVQGTLCYTENFIQWFATQCNTATFRSPGSHGLSFIFLNVADFKGIRAGWHFDEGQGICRERGNNSMREFDLSGETELGSFLYQGSKAH